MLCAVVPAYYEEKRIAAVVTGLLPVVDRVIVVDDGSVDETSVRARQAGALVVRHEINRGQGAALETGHEMARALGATYVVHFDGDGQFSPNEVRPAVAKLEHDKADILFGSRFLGQDQSQIPWLKRSVMLPFGRWIDRLFGAVRLTDSHNGFRVLSHRALDAIHIEQRGMAHATEIPCQVKKHGLTYTEFPITVTYHEFGQGPAGGLKIIRDMFFHSFVS